MKNAYIITNEELVERGLDLNDYALDGTLIPAIIHTSLDICVSRCCYLNDEFLGEKSVEKELDKDADDENGTITTFKKLQSRIIHNLIFMAMDDPVDLYVDTIIVHELGWGKINSFQKGLWYKNQ